MAYYIYSTLVRRVQRALCTPKSIKPKAVRTFPEDIHIVRPPNIRVYKKPAVCVCEWVCERTMVNYTTIDPDPNLRSSVTQGGRLVGGESERKWNLVRNNIDKFVR